VFYRATGVIVMLPAHMPLHARSCMGFVNKHTRLGILYYCGEILELVLRIATLLCTDSI
jgi:hypothetical protein